MSRVRAVWLAVVVAVGVLACGATWVSAGTTGTITVGQAANGSRRALARGDFLVVRLRSNPSTGYAWRVCSAARPVLVLVARRYVPPPSRLLGAPGTAVLRFRAAKSGKTTLRLAYARSWETRAPERTFALRVTVS
jgi:inhibitor of cysteine peptidase